MSVAARPENAPDKTEDTQGLYLTPIQLAEARRLLAEMRQLFEEARTHVTEPQTLR